MKFLEKVSLTIFSIIILFINLLLCLLLFNWIGITDICYVLQKIVSNPTTTNITLVISTILMLLSIKCIFFPSYREEEENSEGILLENESGKLLISVDTIENLIKSAVAGFTSVRALNCKVKLDKQINNVIINLNLVVSSDAVIKELSVNIQNKIKEVVKNATEIEIKEVNIKIKNIEAQKEKNVEV